MSELTAVLEKKPFTWTHANYDSANHVKIEVSKLDSEYLDIVQYISIHYAALVDKISKIERIQNPYAYGRYLLRKEQLEKRGCHVQERRVHGFVQLSRLQEVLVHNFDKRRTPEATPSGDFCLVIMKKLTGENVTRDSNSYIEYVVYLN